MIVPAGCPAATAGAGDDDRATAWRRIMAAVTQLATPQGSFGRGKGSSVGSSSARRPQGEATIDDAWDQGSGTMELTGHLGVLTYATQ